MFVKRGALWAMVVVNFGCVETRRPEKDEHLRDSASRGNDPEAGNVLPATSNSAGSADGAVAANIPVRRCVDGESTEEDTEPTLCDWLNSIDVVAVGEVTSLRASNEFHSVSYSNVRDSVEALHSLGLEAQVPWIDSVLQNKMDGRFHLVESCPTGLRGSSETWKLSVSETLTLAVGLEISRAIKESADGDELEFFIGRAQLQGMSGPAFKDTSVQQDGILAPGTVLGVPLTRSGEQSSLALGWQVPFEVDAQGQIAVQESCYPKMPRELNGLTIAALSAKVDECAADDAAVAAGQGLREQRLRRISAPLQQPHFSARCSFVVQDLRQLQDSGLPP